MNAQKKFLVLSLLAILAQPSCSKVDSPTHEVKKGSAQTEKHDQEVNHKALPHEDDPNEEHQAHREKSKPKHQSTEHVAVTDEKCNPKSHDEKPSKGSHQAHAESGVSAETAFRWLKNGNTRYMKGMLRKDGQSKEDRKRLIAGQKPHTIVLSCSDSRVPPEVLFDQKLGEIFVVRTAGEALDDAAIASIEYALEHLGSHLLVVMAHESCGAVKAALATLGGGDAGSPALNALVKDIHPRIRKFLGREPSKGYVSEAKANAAGVARDLVARSEIVASKLKTDALQIETAVYHLGSGWVEFYSTAQTRGLASEI
jgi:carbonic anhydrase